MFTVRTFRSLMALLAVGLAALALSSAALADTVVGKTDPDSGLTVTASLISNGSDQNVARPGNLVWVSLSVSNTFTERQWVRLGLIASWPTGALPDVSDLYNLKPGKTWRLTFPIFVARWAPAGVYTLGLQAFVAGYFDPAQAVASMTVANS